MKRFLRRILSLAQTRRDDRELGREMEAHLALLEGEYRRHGMTPDDATLAARRAMGSVALAKDQHRDARSFPWIEDAGRDVRYAIRTFYREPTFAIAAIVTLAFGIGASTAMFSVAYGVSLRPLPYADPDRLVRIYESNPASAQPSQDVSEGAFQGWRKGVPSIESASLYGRPGTRFIAGSDQPATAMSVSPAFFRVLRVEPILGPGFKPEQAYTRYTADDEAVISYAAWQRLFGGRPDVIGRSLEFTGAGENDIYRIVGVMPDSFAFAEPVDLWRPTKIVEEPIGAARRSLRSDRVVARIRPGITIERARAELEGVAGRLAREFPVSNGGWTVRVEPLRDSVVGNFGQATWLLLAAVVVVLLVTCLSVASLLVARAVARDREAAVRVALGAGSWRLIRLGLAEASLLSVLGASLGVLLAWLAISALKAAAPPGIPRLDAVGLDRPTFIVAGLSSVLAVVIFAIAPGRRRGEIAAALRRSAGASAGPKAQAIRTVLTLAQCAGAAALVVLAVVLTRSFIKLTSVDLGWDASRVLSLNVSLSIPPDLRRPWYRYVEWSDRVVARLEATPGVARAAFTTQVPLSPQSFSSTLARGRGKAAGDDIRWPDVQHNVTDGYFDVMGIRLIRGRTFQGSDRFTESQLTSPNPVDRGVVIVSESTARALWPGRSALGEALRLPVSDFTARWREVVGVVEDIQFYAVGEKPALHVFVPWTQLSTGGTGGPRLVVKGERDDASLVDTVRSAVRSVEPGTRIVRVERLDALVSRATAQPRFASRVVSLFGALALLLAAVGIYGTLSYLIGARTREIGVRLALGAPRHQVLARTVAGGLVPAIAGGLLGLPIAWALGRLFPTLLFEVAPDDAASSIAGAMVLVLVASVAASLAARRATHVNALAALRTE